MSSHRARRSVTLRCPRRCPWLAIPAVASANVAVDNGVGYVGKGDVQSKLGFNDAAMQSAVTDGTVKFTANVENIVAYKINLSRQQRVRSPRHHSAREVRGRGRGPYQQGWEFVDGWDLNAKLGAPISAGQASLKTIDCPDGAPMWSNAGVTQSSNGITGDLKVNDIASAEHAGRSSGRVGTRQHR